MWINRDLLYNLQAKALLEAVLVQGPRQVGKTSLLERYLSSSGTAAQLDDLAIRTRAQKDPALFFAQFPPPVLIDEFQYAPLLLPEIKLRIDEARRTRRSQEHAEHAESLFFLSGSNQLEIDRAIKETLAGRVSIFTLHGLSASEIFAHFPDTTLSELLWRGGFPELYARKEISPRDYINDYISTFIEKDIAQSGGIFKLEEFLTLTRLLAARVGGILNRDALANDAGVAPKTVSEWVDLLVRMHVVYLLPVYSTNLNKRLTKAPKVYFIDTGLATRLQGHISEATILGAPQVGGLFENLVISEVLKFRDNRRLPCEMSFWRTKEKEELDLIISYGSIHRLIEIKLAIQGVVTYSIPSSIRKEFGESVSVAIVTVSGNVETISENVTRVPLKDLSSFLAESFDHVQ